MLKIVFYARTEKAMPYYYKLRDDGNDPLLLLIA